MSEKVPVVALLRTLTAPDAVSTIRSVVGVTLTCLSVTFDVVAGAPPTESFARTLLIAVAGFLGESRAASPSATMRFAVTVTTRLALAQLSGCPTSQIWYFNACVPVGAPFATDTFPAASTETPPAAAGPKNATFPSAGPPLNLSLAITFRSDTPPCRDTVTASSVATMGRFNTLTLTVAAFEQLAGLAVSQIL